MNRLKKFQILVILVSFTAASCVTQPARAPIPVPAGKFYEGSYINVKAPNSDGWNLVSASPKGMEFARSGKKSNESFGAQVLMFNLQKTNSEDEFLSLIKQSVESDTDRSRFEIIDMDFEYTDSRGYPCVKVVSIVKDKNAQISPTSTEVLTLQSESLYCRHPIRQETGFAIIYSYRGGERHQNFNAEAKQFIAGVQVP